MVFSSYETVCSAAINEMQETVSVHLNRKITDKRSKTDDLNGDFQRDRYRSNSPKQT